ncbi:mucin-1-like isoform X2 [Senna tora]|uniref:Mucin-1-like isoform X2 n=1 Tax=Senna tora TaxID=362788 RepID=A0A834XCN0_9FABA|nr:mucin-1-like isoform X2 [Senna tora]
MVNDAFGFSRNVGVEAHESVDEVESGVRGLHRQYSRDDGDTISFAKEVEEDESPVMDIEASAVNNEDDHMIAWVDQRESKSAKVLFRRTPPFTSNPTPRSPIPTPSLSTHPPPAPIPPFSSNPTPRPHIPTPSLSTDPPSAPTPPLTSDPNTRQVPPYVAKSCNRYWIVDIEDSHGVKREGRLKTNGVWTLPIGQRIIVPFNRQGQPIWEAVGLLKAWQQLEKLSRLVIPHIYEVEMSTEHNLDNHPDFIPYDMWAGFVDYRLNPRTQEMESGGPVSRRAIFVVTHKKRDGSFVNDEAKNVCESRIEVDAKFIPKCHVEAIQIYVYDSLGMTEWRREDV